MGCDADVAGGHPHLEQTRIRVDEGGAAEALHHRRGQRVPQVEEQVGARGRVQVDAALGDVVGQGPAVVRVERHRFGEAVGGEPRPQGRDAFPHVATAPAAAALHRAVRPGAIDALEPDHAGSGLTQGEGPVEVHPEVAAPLGVSDRVRRRQADRDAHAGASPAVGLAGASGPTECRA